jgi:hypothetical protein
MTAKQRTKLRFMQDKLVFVAENLGFSDASPVSQDLPTEVTVGTMKMFLYPQYERTFRDILTEWEGLQNELVSH